MKRILLLLILAVVMNYSNAQGIASSAEETCPLKIGMKIPETDLKAIDGSTIKITEILSQKPTLLIFYRGSWCPFCNMHLAELQEYESQILDLGIQILAISPDLPENLQKSVDKSQLTYTLLSDNTLAFTQKMGLAYRVDDQVVERYKERGFVDLAKASGADHLGLPVPAAYLVDQEGLVHYSYANPNYKVRIDPEVLMMAAKSMVKKEEGE
jgi:peroxiredoxin